MRILFLLCGVGIAITSSSVAFIAWRGEQLTSHRPGELVADAEFVEWHSPPGETAGEKGLAPATYRLRNVGHRDVEILEVIPGCGCLTPSVSLKVVPPGREAVISLQAIPLPVGEKDASIVVRTSSPTRPELRLNLRMFGSRLPPFLLSATGDLTFIDRDFSDLKRTVEVITIERPGPEARRPILRSDIPLFGFEEASFREAPYGSTEFIQRVRSYRVTAKGRPEEDSIVGELRVIDPWEASNIVTLPIHCRYDPACRITPSVKIFDPVSDGKDAIKHLVVKTKESTPSLLISLSGNAEAALIVERVREFQTDTFHRFTIRRKPEAGDAPGEWRLFVKPSPDAAEIGSFLVRVAGRRKEGGK